MYCSFSALRVKNEQHKRERDRAFVEAAIIQRLAVQSKQEAAEQFYQLMNDSPEVAAAGLQSMQIQQKRLRGRQSGALNWQQSAPLEQSKGVVV
jgi:hypothetical protein